MKSAIATTPDTAALCEELDSTLGRLFPESTPDDMYSRDAAGLWRVITEGGWHLMGMAQDRGGGGLQLRDLVDIAVICGRHLLPVPLAITACTLSWASAVGADPGDSSAITFSLPSPRGPGGLAPFASFPGCRLVALADKSACELVPLPAAQADGFARSLPTAQVATVSALSSACLRDVHVLAAAEAVGAARRALERAAAYASQRVQFGHPVATYQAISHTLANMHIDVELAFSSVVWAAHAEPEYLAGAGRALSLCRHVVERAIQVHGGMGFTWDAGIHLYLRHVMAWQKILSLPLA